MTLASHLEAKMIDAAVKMASSDILNDVATVLHEVLAEAACEDDLAALE